MLAAAAAMRLADFGNFIPFLFILYVIYAIFSSMAKAVKQAAQAQKAASASDASTEPQMTAADVRLALQRRLTAAAAARAQAAAAQIAQSAQPVARPAPFISVASSSMPANLGYGDASLLQPPPDTSLLIAPSAVDLSTLLASLPPAAQAIVASAVIGPCAAHRGGGHDPEDW